MSIVINNLATTDNYASEEPTGSVIAPRLSMGAPCAIAEIDVIAEPVFAQLLISPEDAGNSYYAPEVLLQVGHRTLVRKYIYGIQFRSGAAGKPGKVTCELIPVDEVWLEFLLANGLAPRARGMGVGL